jgi:hypothetical protein
LIYGISRARCARPCSRSASGTGRASRWTPSSGPAPARRRSSSDGRSCRNSSPPGAEPIDRAFVHSIFERDHPDTADKRVVDAFADAILALDDSMPNGTYIDMCSKLPVVDPARLTMPTLIMRGQYDGIAALDDLIEFFRRLPHPDKQLSIMPGISHASFQQKNYLIAYHILHAYFSPSRSRNMSGRPTDPLRSRRADDARSGRAGGDRGAHARARAARGKLLEGTRDHDVSQNIATLLKHIEGRPPLRSSTWAAAPAAI